MARAKRNPVPMVEVRRVTDERYFFNGVPYESHLAALEARMVAMIAQRLAEHVDLRDELCKWTLKLVVENAGELVPLLNEHVADIEIKGLRRGTTSR